MNKNEERILLRKAEIVGNIRTFTVGETAPQSEEIGIEEFKERLSKGEKFWSPEKVQQFNIDLRKAISSAFRPEDKEGLLAKADAEIAALVPVTVQLSDGKKVKFFSEKKGE